MSTRRGKKSERKKKKKKNLDLKHFHECNNTSFSLQKNSDSRSLFLMGLEETAALMNAYAKWL